MDAQWIRDNFSLLAIGAMLAPWVCWGLWLLAALVDGKNGKKK